jgi:hypothetical protein
MKKMLTLLMVAAFSTVASATVIEVETYDIGLSGGKLGAAGDAIMIGESVGVRIRMLFKDYGGTYPSYDGYVSDAFGVGINNISGSGAGTLSANVATTDKSGNPATYDITFNSGFDAATKYADTAATNPIDGSGNVTVLSGTSSGIVSANGQINGIILVEGLILTGDAGGTFTLDMIAQAGRYFDFQNNGGTAGYGGSTAFTSDVDSIGDMVVHVAIPEPLTVSLLGLGGLAAARRRRRL